MPLAFSFSSFLRRILVVGKTLRPRALLFFSFLLLSKQDTLPLLRSISRIEQLGLI